MHTQEEEVTGVRDDSTALTDWDLRRILVASCNHNRSTILHGYCESRAVLYKVNSGKNLSIRQNSQSAEKLKHAVANGTNELPYIYRRKCRRNRKKWGDIKMAFYNVHKSSMLMKLASYNVFWQSKVHLHSQKDYICTYDICAHNSLPKSTILALGFKGCYQHRCYCTECLYSQRSLKV